MKIRTKYQGSNDAFEGDRMLWLRNLPGGASITKATVTLTTTNAPEFQETFTFLPDQLSIAQWGITKTSAGAFVEVDFHSRRTLTAIAGSGGNGTLQIDVGGAYVGIANDGTLMAPGKVDLPVNLSSTTTTLPSLTLNKFKLTKNPNNTTNTSILDITKVIIRSVPNNISVRVGQLPPFWTRLGELATFDTSPDFAAVLNAYLVTAQLQEGFYQIPFIIHSDTIARLDVELVIDFIIEQPILPPFLPEVKLAYNFSTLPNVDEALTTVKLPRGAIAIKGRSSAQILGEFQSTRIAFGPVGDDPTSIPSNITEINVVVSPNQQLAQALKPNQEINVTDIDVPLSKIEPGLAGLHIAIQKDDDGKPSGEILTRADVRVDKSLPNESTWGSATLPAPFRVEAGKRYWLVLQSQVSETYWVATHDTIKNVTDNPGLQSSNNGGLSWREATVEKAPSPLRALFRLRNTPEKFSVPVQLQIGKGPDAVRLRLDEFAPLGRIEFNFDFAQPLSKFLNNTVKADPCGSGNLLVNGDFTDPPPDNATQKLFGFDRERKEAIPPREPDGGDVILLAASPTESNRPIIIGKVDLSRGINLSVERFIVLALDDKPPIRIDCAGKDPARTQLDEIINAINKATRSLVASQQRGYLTVQSGIPTTTKTSIELYPWCSTQVSGWQNTQGQMYRVNDTNRVGVMLVNAIAFSQAENATLACFPRIPSARISTTNLASLSQSFSVVAGCAYLFQFSFDISFHSNLFATSKGNYEPPPPPRWDIIWLNATGATLRTDTDVLEFITQISSEEPTPWFYETRLSAPPDAVKAELSFVNSFSKQYALILENVAFTPTSSSFRNSQFRQWESESNTDNQLPAGWKSLGGWIVKATDDETGQIIGVQLLGDSPEEAVLVQTAEIVATERYELQINGRSLSLSNSNPETQLIQQRTRVELHWLDKSSNSIDTPVIIPLDGRDFPAHTWVGNAPAAATSAEIRIIKPKNQGDLLVEFISFARADLVWVPLIFLSETPGELTVSKLRVAYDLPESSQPTPPPSRRTSTPNF